MTIRLTCQAYEGNMISKNVMAECGGICSGFSLFAQDCLSKYLGYQFRNTVLVLIAFDRS